MDIFDLQNYPKVKIMLAFLFAENKVIARNNNYAKIMQAHQSISKDVAACGTVNSSLPVCLDLNRMKLRQKISSDCATSPLSLSFYSLYAILVAVFCFDNQRQLYHHGESPSSFHR